MPKVRSRHTDFSRKQINRSRTDDGCEAHVSKPLFTSHRDPDATLQNFLIRVTLRDVLICTLLRARTESGGLDHEHRLFNTASTTDAVEGMFFNQRCAYSRCQTTPR